MGEAMRGRFASLRVVRRAQRGQVPGPEPVRLRSAAYASQAPTRSTAWPMNDAGPSWATVRPRRGAVGHQHLRVLLRVHAALHRGGVRAAVTALTLRTIMDGVFACRYFGLDAVAALWARVPQAISSVHSADLFDAEYREQVATGRALADAIRRKIAARPEDFPVGPI
jgi:hypothetical protein